MLFWIRELYIRIEHTLSWWGQTEAPSSVPGCCISMIVMVMIMMIVMTCRWSSPGIEWKGISKILPFTQIFCCGRKVGLWWCCDSDWCCWLNSPFTSCVTSVASAVYYVGSGRNIGLWWCRDRHWFNYPVISGVTSVISAIYSAGSVVSSVVSVVCATSDSFPFTSIYQSGRCLGSSSCRDPHWTTSPVICSISIAKSATESLKVFPWVLA